VRKPRTVYTKICLSLLAGLVACTWGVGAQAECDSERQNEANRAYQEAHQFIQKQQWDLAIPRLQSILDFCPEHVYSLRGLGLAYLKLGRYDLAIRAYGRAVEVQGEDVVAADYASLAKAYAKDKDYQAARAEYMKAQQLLPDDCGINFNLGILHMAANFTTQAVETLQHAEQTCPQLREQILPQLTKACQKAADQQRKIGNLDKAAHYDQLAKQYGSSAGGTTAYAQAVASMKSGDYKTASTQFEQLVAQNPQNANAYLSLARCYDQLGQKAKSADAYGSYLKLKPNDMASTAAMIQVMVEAGQCSAAQAQASAAVASHKSQGQKVVGKVYYAWGKALECSGDYEEAKAKFSRYLASGDTDWVAQAHSEISRMDQYIDYNEKKKQKEAQDG